MDKVDKRRRNARPSRYRPRTEAQKQRRKDLWAAREADRRHGRLRSEEDDLRSRLNDLETALRDQGRLGVHNRRHVRPLDEIEDDAQRFAVLKARVERLEALWTINQRKRQTRGKIIIGGALIAEVSDHFVEDREDLLQRLVDIIDRRVDTVFDRLTVRELMGDIPLALTPGGSLDDPADDLVKPSSLSLPDFDAIAESAMADEHEDEPEVGPFGATTPPIEKIFWDLIRLEMLANQGVECLFVLGGKRKKLEALFAHGAFDAKDNRGHRTPLLRHDNNVIHTTTLGPTVEARRPMLRKLFADYQDFAFPNAIQSRRSAPFPRDPKASVFQVYAWEIKASPKRTEFWPRNSAQYRQASSSTKAVDLHD